MVIYEVNLSVPPGLAGEFHGWLQSHLQDMLQLPGFQRADLYAVDGVESNAARWTVHYRLSSARALDDYLRDHAQRMRAEGTDRFGAKLSASRRVLVPAPAPSGMATPSPVQIKDIDHVVLRVRDLEPMLAFYRDVLLCPLEKQQPDIGLYQLRCGSSLIDLATVDGPLGQEGGAAPGDEGHNLDHFCVRVEPFDAKAIRAWLESRGVEAGEVASRYGADGQGPSIYVKDPEGNTVEFKGPPAG